MTASNDTQMVETKEDRDVIFDVNPPEKQVSTPTPQLKVYKFRWVILALFSMLTVINTVQYMEYSIISNVVQQYYGVDASYVDWMAIVFLFICLPFNYPSVWLLDKKGLRLFVVLGAAMNCLAAWIKVFSIQPDRFYVVFIGQTIAGISSVFTINAPSRVAAVWFGPDQVSTATSIAVFGSQLGAALGFLLPPILVQPHDDIADIGRDLATMCYIVAGVCSVLLVLIVLFFRDKPELPPSPNQATTREADTSAVIVSLKHLARNRNFVLLMIVHGVIIGTYGGMSTVLNSMVLTYFPGHEQDVGRLGLTLIVAGMVGSTITGVILDKTHKFKATALTVYACATVAMLAFTFTLRTNLGALYGVTAFLGFFVTGFLAVGYEFAAELTFPEPEGTTAMLIGTSSTVFSVLLTVIASSLINSVGDLGSNLTLTAILGVGIVLTAFIKQDLRRSAANELWTEKSLERVSQQTAGAPRTEGLPRDSALPRV